MKVVCTIPMDPAGMAILPPHVQVVNAPDARPETLYGLIADADFLVVRTKLPDDIFSHPNRLLGVIRHGVGLDFIPVDAATEKGIPVANVPGSNARAVAEYCISAFLVFARRLEGFDASLRREGWAKSREAVARATELGGRTLGIVGLGTIGLALARACHHGLGMRVTAYHPRPRKVPEFVEMASLEVVLAGSDYVSLHCPLTAETRYLINAERLALMKQDAILVNAARGAIIDEAALLAALEAGRLRGAALDVFTQQPLAPDHPFLKSGRLLLTPHIAGITRESAAVMGIGTARQIVQLMAGERPEHLVNPSVWEGYLRRRQNSPKSP